MRAAPDIGRIGLWSIELRFGDRAAARDAAAELEDLGYGALWIPGGIDDAVLGDVSALLAATRRCPIATGILNIWKIPPATVGEWWRGVTQRDRVLLGLGVSHGPLIGEDYRAPLGAMRAYLDGLDQAGVAPEARCLAALGPKMLELAAARSAGAHPYLVPPEHSAQARARMGSDALLAPEQGVILETDPAKARAIARAAVDNYLRLPNYVNNWRRLGFTEEDVTQPSARLLDALFAWGSVEDIVRRVQAHLDAGADHVCLQVIRGAPGDLSPPLAEWRALAEALLPERTGCANRLLKKSVARRFRT